MDKTNQTQDNIRKENLISDAAYRKKSTSKAPMLDGAFRGALASGLVSKVARPKSRMGEAALIGMGTTIGAIMGQADHTNKLKAKVSAQGKLRKESMSHYIDTPSESSSLASDGLTGGLMGGGLGALSAPRGLSRRK